MGGAGSTPTAPLCAERRPASSILTLSQPSTLGLLLIKRWQWSHACGIAQRNLIACSAGGPTATSVCGPLRCTRTALTDRDVTEPIAAPTPAVDSRGIHGRGRWPRGM